MIENIKWTNLERVLNEYADTVIQLTQDNLQQNGNIATGNLLQMEKVIEVGDDWFKVYLSLQDYWKYIEEGRGAGKFPPPDAIRNWIEVKNITPEPDANGRTPSVDQLTFLISRKIAEEGTEAHPFLEPAKQEALQRFEQSIEYAIEEDVKVFIEENVEELMKETFGK